MAINLDNILDDQLNSKQPQPQKQQEAPVVKINWNDIMTEWCYRIPKGYPTVVDGVFTEYEEVKVLNEILEEKLGETIPLPEVVEISKDQLLAKILKTSAMSKVFNIVSTKPGAEITAFVAGIKQGDRVQKIRELLPLLQAELGSEYSVKPNAAFPNKKKIDIRVGKTKITLNFQAQPTENKTDTNVKEGYSVLFGYYPEAIELFTKENLKKNATGIAKYLQSKNNITGLSKDIVSAMVVFAQKATTTQDKKTIDKFVSFFNQALSHGRTFDAFFEKNGDFYIERGEFFERIRAAGSKISKEAKDKWCPGDVYFIRNGSESIIEPALEAIEKSTEDIAPADRARLLIQLNNLFSATFNGKVSANTPIVAVSLKMADAQAGKLKSGLESYKPQDVATTYNLTKDEQKYTLADFNLKTGKAYKAVKKQQEIIESIVKAENNSKGGSTFIWQPKFDIDKLIADNNIPGKKGEGSIEEQKLEILKFKYAAYKAFLFIYEAVAKQDKTQVDIKLGDLVAFGLGVAQTKLGGSTKPEDPYINPPFFKVIANADGTAMIDSSKRIRPQFFKPGSVVSLASAQATAKRPIIKIVDSQYFKGFELHMFITLSGKKPGQYDKYEIVVAFRSNGSSQATIELQTAHLMA
jgi:hypothetical protein